MFRRSLSSQSGSKSCRICLESNNSTDLISPCLCRGGSAYVHRKCLDDWRALNKNDRGFKYCEVCQFEYVIETVGDDPSGDKKRLWIFRLLVTRDITAIVLLIQAVIIGLAFLMQAADESTHGIRDLYPDWMSSYGVYYLSSLILFLAILGIFGLFGFCYMMASNDRTLRSDTNCLYCFFFCGNCNSSSGSSDCNCNGSGGGGGGEGIVVVLLVIVVLLAVLGIFFGIIIGSVIIKGIIARHAKKLWLRQETKKYIVKDLEGKAHEYTNRTARGANNGSPTSATTNNESYLPRPTAPIELSPVKTKETF